jgi:hypothetical protein
MRPRSTIGSMNAETLPRDASAAVDAWRPMAFGLRPARHVENPVVEPAWGGPRVLVLVDRESVEARDEYGSGQAIRDDLRAALVAALAATGTTTALIDGHLTSAVVHDTTGVSVGFEVLDEVRPADVGRQMLLGGGSRRDRRRDRIEADMARRALPPADEPVALVAIDLLWIDDDALIDVPLLERKRLLEAAIKESDLVRVSPHVRPPIEAWYGQWRAFGFHEVAVRDANSRYRPGERSDAWATAMIPRR